jgi:hypothetical protein
MPQSGNASGTNLKEIEDLKYKIDRLEKEIKLMSTTDKTIPKVNKATEVKEQKGFKPEIKKSSTVKLGEKVKNWPKIVDQIKQQGKITLYTNLLNSSANQINDMTVGINFEKGITPFGKAILEKPENMGEIVKQVSIELGKPMRVILIDNNDEIMSKADNFNSIEKDIDMPINIID